MVLQVFWQCTQHHCTGDPWLMTALEWVLYSPWSTSGHCKMSPSPPGGYMTAFQVLGLWLTFTTGCQVPYNHMNATCSLPCLFPQKANGGSHQGRLQAETIEGNWKNSTGCRKEAKIFRISVLFLQLTEGFPLCMEGMENPLAGCRNIWKWEDYLPQLHAELKSFHKQFFPLICLTTSLSGWGLGCFF